MEPMGLAASKPGIGESCERALQAYLLGSVEFDAALALQRRLVYQAASQPYSASLLLCEHPPLITVGRQGSRAHILCEPDELKARRWSIRWVNRGGACILHLPGQLAIYSILPLHERGIGLNEYLTGLQSVVVRVLRDFSLAGEAGNQWGTVLLGGRAIATIGVAVCNWVTYYGIMLNVNPDLEPFRRVRCVAGNGVAMTSLERERRAPLSASLVRERVLAHFAAQFGFERTSLFFEPPALSRKAPTDAVAASR
jgi:lipoyl(octanoyl) transferase